jgi:hypothetical protein
VRPHLSRRNTVTDTDTATSVEDQLDQWLERSLAELGEEPADLDHAGKLLGAMRGIDRRITEVDATVERRIKELRAFQNAQRIPLLERRAYLDKLIGGWALAEWERTGRKTWKTPDGAIEVRPRKVRTVIDSRIDLTDEVIGTIEATLPSAVKVERSILVSGVKSDDVWTIEPGRMIRDYPDVPPGYAAFTVLRYPRDVAGALGEELPGLVTFLPLGGRDGQTATARPGKGTQ